MAGSNSLAIQYLFLLVLSVGVVSISCSKSKPQTFFLPIGKDPQTNLFYTSLGIGTPRHQTELVIDVGGPIVWYDCNARYNSTTYRPVSCNQCPTDSFCGGCVSGPFKPGCSNNTCASFIFNPFSDVIFTGDLGEDLLFISNTTVSGMLTVCTDSDRLIGDPSNSLLKGLPKTSKGILGLASSTLALQLQFSKIASVDDLPSNFSLCFPSSNKNGLGTLFIGEVPKNYAPSKYKIFTTPLIVRPLRKAPTPISTRDESSYEYFIITESIKVGAKVLDFEPSLLRMDEDGTGGTKISSMDPFTVLHSSIYKPLVTEFMRQASDRKMKKVGAVAPFGACYDLSSIGWNITGLDVPTIDLVVSDGVQWRIYGANSMVLVSKTVACLAFVDGGKHPKTSVVIGGHQLEDNFLEFDWVSSKLAFSSSLLLHNQRCFQFTG